MNTNKLVGKHNRRKFLGIAAASATSLATRGTLAASGRQSSKKGFCTVVCDDGEYQMFARPLWITEFAVGDWQAKSAKENKHRPQRIAQFMREAIPLLEQARFVHRYAWFSAKTDNRALGTSALLDNSGQLTELGKIYRSR